MGLNIKNRIKDYSGLYCITNACNGKKYIGKSIGVRNRIYQHKSDLRRGEHQNKHLQSSRNKYGEGNFKFETILKCEPEDMKRLETQYIYETNSIESMKRNTPKYISKYDMSGKLLGTYESANKVALSITNGRANRSLIIACANGKVDSYYGFVWKFADEQKTA